MNLTVEELYNLTKGLNELLDKELSTSVAFTIQRNFKKVSDEVKTADETRKKLVEKYDDYIEDNRIEDVEKREEYNGELKELLSQEVDVDVKEIRLSELGESIKPRTLGLLETIIKEGEKE